MPGRQQWQGVGRVISLQSVAQAGRTSTPISAVAGVGVALLSSAQIVEYIARRRASVALQKGLHVQGGLCEPDLCVGW